MSATHPLSGKRYRGLLDDGGATFERQLDTMMSALHADGYPPFTAPNDERREYDELVRLRDARAPAFYTDSTAQPRLEALSRKYGYAGPASGGVQAIPPPTGRPAGGLLD